MRLAPLDGAIGIALLALVTWLGIALLPALVDDSFIYLRIASNIGTGSGWLYNVGEVGNAATSTLYTLLVTVVGAVFGYSARSLALTYAFSLYALLALQYLAWRKPFGRVLALMIALGCGLNGHLLGAFGMESALLMALVTATALAYRHYGDGWAAGVLAGLTALTRPEGIAVLGVLGLIELVRHRRIAWRSVLAAALVVAPWLLFATLYFGSPTSHTAAVKAAQRHYGWWATQPDFVVTFLNQARWLWLTLILGGAGAVLALRRCIRGDNFAAICIGFGIVQVLGYQLLDAPSGYTWYDIPGNFAVDMAIMLLFATVISAALAHVAQRPARLFAATTLSAALALLLMTRIAMVPWYFPGSYGYSKEYRQVADWLHTHAHPDDSVAATEIGYLGWYSHLRVLDIHGLLHARALPYLRRGNLHWWWDSGERPRYVVVHGTGWHGEPGSAETWPAGLSADFHKTYQEVFHTDVMRVYERTAGS